jgi:hypothetical protein
MSLTYAVRCWPACSSACLTVSRESAAAGLSGSLPRSYPKLSNSSAEIDEMVTVIPEQELSIQWDIAAEVTVMETPQLSHIFPKQELIGSLVRAVDHVPVRTEVGLHLCYGDPGGKHVIEPKDLSLLVELANAIKARAAPDRLAPHACAARPHRRRILRRFAET